MTDLEKLIDFLKRLADYSESKGKGRIEIDELIQKLVEE
jgi:hypothetical protein